MQSRLVETGVFEYSKFKLFDYNAIIFCKCADRCGNGIDNLSLYYNRYYFIILLLYFRMYPSVMCFFLSGTLYSVVDAGFGDVLKITVIRFKDQP